ncbi:MAG: asparagine synthase (glutamine-hydrolyzing) [Thermodesulfovibrionales bacterium]
MCGIAGVWGDGNIVAMTRVLAHRGPDDEGFYEDARKGIKLGNRRLKIVDLEGGHQPIHNEDKTIWVTFNGEIFNYRTLRKQLIDRGHVFYTNTDTEVIVHAYEEFGEKCLDYFIGMFAFAVWDGTKLFLARDRMGEKPLFYCRDGDRFLFASEIKAILEEISPAPFLHPDFFVFEDNLTDDTLFQGIKELKPAHSLVFDGRELRLRRYWTPETYDSERRSDKFYIDRLSELLYDAVQIRLMGDVPWGMYLSGGLDSSLIACIAKPEIVFSATYHNWDPRFDEAEYSCLIAKKIGARQVFVSSTPQEVESRFSDIIWYLDQPISTSSTITSFKLSEEASKHVKFVLNGQGADEVFGGYTRYIFMLIEDSMRNSEWLKNYEPMARRFWGGHAFIDPAERYFNFIKRTEPATADPLRLIQRAFSHQAGIINQIGYADMVVTLPHLITMDDRGCAHAGIESRSPFLDHRIVEFAFQLPLDLKIREYETKYILRQAARCFCPPEVLYRFNKMGMVSPIGVWLQRELAHWSTDLSMSLRKRKIGLPILGPEEYGIFDRRLHAVISMELWFRRFHDNGTGR